MPQLLVAAWLIAASAASGESTRVDDLEEVAVRLGKNGVRVEVVGLPPQTLAAVREADLSPEQWKQLFAVAVADDGATPVAPMLGTYAVDGEQIVFTPRFPLRPGLKYRAIFDFAAIPGNPFPNVRKFEAKIALPKPRARPAATVAAVYPSGDALPANLLKLYIHFSAPMSRGGSYRRIRMVDADGRDVPDAFLELGEELWNSEGTRLTVLFDPGRIKRGLKPNDDVGAPLVEERKYALVIDAGWPDAHGTPIERKYLKPFRVTAPDNAQPDPLSWRIAAPAAGTIQPLAIEFDEPLDRALVETMLVVRNSAEREITGRVTVDCQETQWQFQPEATWQSGNYQLVVDAAIEDLAGNSVGRPFETQGPADARSDDSVVLHFEIPAQ